MSSIILVITIISILVHSIQASSSAFVIAEKLLRGSGDHCQTICDERPDCIFSYCVTKSKVVFSYSLLLRGRVMVLFEFPMRIMSFEIVGYINI
ncbi:hypothetical protein Pmar_PMAR022137 [Perkinsus marinus ATCC 50983]|uniref:Uncharacterized protein n=1 Tax=Perkinsus marinus (strain ATCC 50983 / TXsc) TaxID=423536 RepID=C5L0P7_PERM5|nr:hypothetical protein Pmar_PMAR022137 [Perkinsus marinus ATCC 50983]EER09699.1 hypothetical protein Pmar_PMAR022137 [Perkinsus marinus ATCC 50983]|eukprot:XP_002777904.1 hypothetical protein Pmar_PMAR022137 [Perkinsus marinus ATCC 50983]